MAVSSIKIIFQSNIKKVWDIVTSVEGYTWRSDLGKTEILNEKQFVEYTKDGYGTTFTITKMVPYKRWEFDMENENIKGHWIGIFKQKEEETEVEFTEDVSTRRYRL